MIKRTAAERFILKKCHSSQWKALCGYHAVDSTYLPQAGSYSPPRMEPCAFSKWFKRGGSLQLCVSGLTTQALDYCVLSINVKLFTDVMLKVDPLRFP